MTDISEGTYMARGISLDIGEAETGTPGAAVVFSITEGPFKDKTIEWKGWLSEKTKERTAESLAICGFDGEDERTISTNIVQIVVEHEQYTSEKNGKTYTNAKVKWINDPNRGRAQFAPMDEGKKAQAKATLRGLILVQKELRAKLPLPAEQASFNHGHNAVATPAPPIGGAPAFKAKF